MTDKNKIVVTTGNLKDDYDVIGPVYFQVSNKGLFSSDLSRLQKKYYSEIQEMRSKGLSSRAQADWGFLYGEWSVGQNQFDQAFYVSTQELKSRAAMLDADAIIGMRQDIDLDTNGFSYFYLQMYGTAVRFKDPGKRVPQKENINITSAPIVNNVNVVSPVNTAEIEKKSDASVSHASAPQQIASYVKYGIDNRCYIAYGKTYSIKVHCKNEPKYFTNATYEYSLVDRNKINGKDWKYPKIPKLKEETGYEWITLKYSVKVKRTPCQGQF